MSGLRRGGRRREGFTLLELLMVVIIIAILAAIALPQYLRVTERSRFSEALTLAAAIRTAELRYRAADPGGLYTQNLSLLDTELPGLVAPGNTTSRTASWDLTVSGTAAGSNVDATRRGGPAAGLVEMDIEQGGICTAVAAAQTIYNLTAAAAGCP